MIKFGKKTEKVCWENLFSLEIPKSWSVYEEDNLISLYDESNGVGALQISFVKREKPEAPTATEAMELAVDYAKQRDWEVSHDSLCTLNINGSPASKLWALDDDNDGLNYWVVWHVMGTERAAFITYNCLNTDKSIESKTCDLIVSSFHWL